MMRLRIFQKPDGLWTYHVVDDDSGFTIACADPDEEHLDPDVVLQHAEERRRQLEAEGAQAWHLVDPHPKERQKTVNISDEYK
jgi:hypothetical protein